MFGTLGILPNSCTNLYHSKVSACHDGTMQINSLRWKRTQARAQASDVRGALDQAGRQAAQTSPPPSRRHMANKPTQPWLEQLVKRA